MLLVWVIPIAFLLDSAHGGGGYLSLGNAGYGSRSPGRGRQHEITKLISKLALINNNGLDFEGEAKTIGQASSPTSTALKDLCNLHTSYDEQSQNQPLHFSEKQRLADEFLEAVISTRVVQEAVEYLRAKDLLSRDEDIAFSQLRTLWFGGEAGETSLCALVDDKDGLTSPDGEVGEISPFARLKAATPEFQLAAFTVCALAQPSHTTRFLDRETTKTCTFVIDRFANEANAVVSMEFDGAEGNQRIVSAHFSAATQRHPEPAPPSTNPDGPFFPYLENHRRRNSTRRRKNSTDKADPDLQKLVDGMWKADAEDRVSNSTITFNWGKHVDGDKDVSNNSLFASVNETFLQRPLYNALIDIYNQTLFHPPVCKVEPTMGDKRYAALNNFLNIVTNTTVFKQAYEFLKARNKTGSDYNTFHTNLFNLWFGTYSRCNAAQGSSGWEHVFSGEYRDTIVDGQHYWVRYYLLEKAGEINYHGYYSYDENLLATIQYTWNDYHKKIGGFLLRSSPAFDLALFTVCTYTHIGNEKCKFTINGNPLFVTSFKQSCTSGTCLSTSYPGKKF